MSNIRINKTIKWWHKTLILICLLISYTLPSYAQWYETRGHARTDTHNVEIARTKAMESALKKALLVAGADVSSVQRVVNGLLTQDKIDIRATGSVNAIEIVNETHSDNLISVTIRADIFPQEKQCFAVNFKKSVLLTKSKVKHRQQANIGQIYAIDKAVINKLSEQLSKQSNYTSNINAVNNTTEFSRLNNNLDHDKITELARTLGYSTNSQYVIFSEINDISFEEDRTNSWKVWQQGIYPRNFAIDIYLYNGISGEQHWHQQYQGTKPWTFTKRKAIDVNGVAFWKSEYGTMIDKLLNQVVTDIDETIMCEPSRGKILRVDGNQITFNLGRNNGVKVGDEFTILRLKHFTDNTGSLYTGYTVSPHKVKVTQLTRETALAASADNSLFNNIQIEDLVVRY